ncbi:hypothetical protein SDC9_186951 [bioreactor metagenome]|uniref:Uncharacterized protein n=1 Tax=bioreactor metagenome TaxID=1076179 RepID=A0A645HVN4_9ZZZZ
MHGINGAVRGGGREYRPRRGARDAEAALLALHISPRLHHRAEIDISALSQLRRRRLFIIADDRQRGGEHDEHREKDRPPLPLVLNAPPV